MQHRRDPQKYVLQGTLKLRDNTGSENPCTPCLHCCRGGGHLAGKARAAGTSKLIIQNGEANTDGPI